MISSILRRSLITVAVIAFLAGASAQAGQRFTIMAYNVENLFDTTHDPGKEDWTYLPLAVKRASKEAMKYCNSLTNKYYRDDCLNINWDQNLLNQKLDNLGRVIRAVNGGLGPEILVVEEVENINALTQLRDRALAGLGYQTVVLIEGPDKRGIDVGVISKFPLARKPQLHEINTVKDAGSAEKLYTRGILEVQLIVGQERVTVLANHWPSQSNSDYARAQAGKTMYEIASSIRDGSLVVSAGDFNTLPSDSPNAIGEWVTNSSRPGFFYDAEAVRRGMHVPPGTPSLMPGTHYYRGNWDSLDRIFVKTCNCFSGMELCSRIAPLYASFQILAEDWMMTLQGKDKIPYRFDEITGGGFTDHLPVVMQFEVQ